MSSQQPMDHNYNAIQYNGRKKRPYQCCIAMHICNVRDSQVLLKNSHCCLNAVVCYFLISHYNDVIKSAMASQITSVSIVYSTVCYGADQRKHQSSASLSFVRGIHRWPVNPSHKRPVTQKFFRFGDVTMIIYVIICVTHGLTTARGSQLSSRCVPINAVLQCICNVRDS